MGQPTLPEIQLLMAVYGDIRRDGQIIPWVAIEEILQRSRAERRFHTVVNRWCKHMLIEKGVKLEARNAKGQGLLVLTSGQMVDYGIHQLAGVERNLNRGTTVVQHAHLDELEPYQQQKRDHVLKFQSTMLAYMATARSTIPTPPRTPTVPPYREMAQVA